MEAGEKMERLEAILRDLEDFLEEEEPIGLPRCQEEAGRCMSQVLAWQERLRELGERSCSGASRRLAQVFLKEDQEICRCLHEVGREDRTDGEHNLRALSLEYLEDRARQALREVLLEAWCLRRQSEEENEKKGEGS